MDQEALSLPALQKQGQGILYSFAIWFSHSTLHASSSKTSDRAVSSIRSMVMCSLDESVYSALLLLMITVFVFHCLCRQCHNKTLSYRPTRWQRFHGIVSRVGAKSKGMYMWCEASCYVRGWVLIIDVARLLSQKFVLNHVAIFPSHPQW